jgi:cyclic pyranopterin phosphate synthase
MPAEAFPADYPFLTADRLLSFPEIARVVEAAVPLGLKKVKLTGGEPLLRSLLPELVLSLKTRFPQVEVGLITNGLHLAPLLPRFKAARLDSVTVSIDSLDAERFAAMTGNGHRVSVVLEAIEEARQVFGRVKLNAVVIRGKNEDQIEPLVRHFRRPGFDLRFIEYMDVGTLNRWDRSQVVTGDEVLAHLKCLVPGVGLDPVAKSHPGETSERWAWADGRGMVGFINSISRPFCGDCSRARLSADGKLYTCLFSSAGHDLAPLLRAGATQDGLSAKLSAIWTGRKDRYSEERPVEAKATPASRVEMFAVGG